MANMTLAIPADLRATMSRFPEINWSEVARQAILQKTRELLLDERLMLWAPDPADAPYLALALHLK